ncbi:MAG: hypothetical protein G8345_07750 [Magnetococcales bacterium]|nr:hypothetical protein [Magnetococcales bacterium]NGZ26769.1 hypothetical protein [Magnetococcales bacterium]
MAVLPSEIKFYKSTFVNDGSTNGGRMSANEITDNVKNNLWPDVPQSERLAGSSKYRKCFIKIANDSDLGLISPRFFVETQTPGEDRVLIFAGTQTDTEADLTGSERLYGSGALNANASAGASSIQVNVEAAADAIFQNGDLIRISDKATVNAETGNTEFIRLAASNAVSWNGTVATLTFENGATLAYAYTTANSTRVASVIEGDSPLEGTVSDWLESSVAGTYDEVSYPLESDHIGGIEQEWTITFTSATAFTCSGDTVGAVSGGTIGSDFSPNNSDFSKPYFLLRSTGWGGTWATNDTLIFTTHPAAQAIWEKRIIPANTASLSGNKVIIGVSGESE